MKYTTSHAAKTFTKVVAFASLLGLALYAGGARADDGSAPNPSAKLVQAQQVVTDYESGDVNTPINLHSIDVDYTVGELASALSLTSAQQASARQLLAAQKESVAIVRGDKSLSRVERSNRTETIYRNTVVSLSRVLTSTQLLKAKSIGY